MTYRILDRDRGSGLFARLTSDPLLVGLAATFMLLAVAAISVHLLRARSDALRELERLTQLREAYDVESAAE